MEASHKDDQQDTRSRPTVDLSESVLHLSGDFCLRGPRPEMGGLLQEISRGEGLLRVVDEGIGEWDSTLMSLMIQVREEAMRADREVDVSDMPEGVQRLIELAQIIPGQNEPDRPRRRKGGLETIGLHALGMGSEFALGLSFLGETVGALSRWIRGKARFPARDLWVQVEQCGPQALAITSLISFLVGAILAFVGAEQLSMFSAEVYVANLVGLGMVMEMGALMTGIILAGRTGAAFAAQIGTMQVNEEVDALKTLGLSPMEYLVLPRVLALALMTPLLVVYANGLGILGGAAVGVGLLNIPSQVFFGNTFEFMTPWLCMQGLIKGSTYGILVALAGCMRGMHCGRSASAVGRAATSAVVTSLIWIVTADALWTLLFMHTG